MKMATNFFILLMIMMASTSIHTHSTIGKGFKEYAEKSKGTIKTIKWQGRDLVDCVEIYNQPSMDHPLLKNHTIELVPNSLIKHNVSYSNHINTPENEQCPHGSIPIRRPFKDELGRATFPPSRHEKRITINDGAIHKYAVLSQPSNGPRLVGVYASLNVWKPITDDTTFSLAQLWLVHEAQNIGHEVVEAGWMVYPSKFGDGEPRFFIFFTNDGYITGCYNLDCLGFVQISRTVCLGCSLNPQSIFEGNQSEIGIRISQSSTSKSWWIKFNDEFVGYYPSRLFTRLRESGATHVKWGGEVTQWPNEGPSSNHMGSGHFPSEGFKKAAYFQDLQYEEVNNIIYTPVYTLLRQIVTHPHCYGISQFFGEGQGQLNKAHFYYGGPGASAPGCDV